MLLDKLFSYVEESDGFGMLGVHSGFNNVLRDIEQDRHFETVVKILREPNWQGVEIIAYDILLRMIELIPNHKPPYEHRHDLHFAAYLWILSHHERARDVICKLILCVPRLFWAHHMAKWLLYGDHMIEIDEIGEVAEYVAQHDMQDFVRRVVKATRERFPSASLELRVYHDPETPDKHLGLYIRMGTYPDGILDTIEDIWQEFEEEHAELSGWLLVTTNFERQCEKDL